MCFSKNCWIIDNIYLLNFKHDKKIKRYVNELKDFVLPLACKFSNELYELLRRFSIITEINIKSKDRSLNKIIPIHLTDFKSNPFYI